MTLLADSLLAARSARMPLAELPPALLPADAAAAFDVQHELLHRLGQSIGGWKVGAKGAEGPIQGSPLPAQGVLESPANWRADAWPMLGLELEVAFVLGRSFAPSAVGYADAEVIAAVASMAATIELVASRFCGHMNIDTLAQLADLQNHGALVVGEPVAHDTARRFDTPALRFSFNGTALPIRTGHNPAGDPRRLLGWVVNHATRRGLTLPAGTLVTTGSLIGLFVPPGPGVALGEIDGLPPVQLSIV